MTIHKVQVWNLHHVCTQIWCHWQQWKFTQGFRDLVIKFYIKLTESSTRGRYQSRNEICKNYNQLLGQWITIQILHFWQFTQCTCTGIHVGTIEKKRSDDCRLIKVVPKLLLVQFRFPQQHIKMRIWVPLQGENQNLNDIVKSHREKTFDNCTDVHTFETFTKKVACSTKMQNVVFQHFTVKIIKSMFSFCKHTDNMCPTEGMHILYTSTYSTQLTAKREGKWSCLPWILNDAKFLVATH